MIGRINLFILENAQPFTGNIPNEESPANLENEINTKIQQLSNPTFEPKGNTKDNNQVAKARA